MNEVYVSPQTYNALKGMKAITGTDTEDAMLGDHKVVLMGTPKLVNNYHILPLAIGKRTKPLNVTYGSEELKIL